MNNFTEIDNWLNNQLQQQEELSRMQPITHLELPEDVITGTQDSLKALITPYVEIGFDAHQIKEELAKQDERLIPVGHIESVISIILGEQQC